MKFNKKGALIGALVGALSGAISGIPNIGIVERILVALAVGAVVATIIYFIWK